MKLAWALCQQAGGATRVAPRMKDFLVQAVGLAALGTVADVVPLVHENRVLVRHGLESLANAPTLGFATLMEIAKVTPRRCPDGKMRLDAEDLGFQIAPRLNAAGRLGQPQLAVELLVTDRPDRAKELAQYIDGLNATRQTIERSIQLAASKQARERFDPVDDAALVLADWGWHAGVIGIVAGRLADKFHRPVVMISWDKTGMRPGIGSAAACRASTCTRPWPSATSFCWLTAVTRRRRACESKSTNSTASAGRSARWRPRESAATSARRNCL